MKLIYVGDLHVKSNKFHKKGLDDFFNNELYPLIHELQKKDEVAIVLLGDEFDTSSPDWDSWCWLVDHIKKWPKTYIVNGNHSSSIKKGNATLSLNALSNVTVCNVPTMETIDNCNLIFFPYPDNSDIKESYNIYCEQNLDFKKQYIAVTHFASTKNQFSETEGIDINLPKGSITIEGHTHISARYFDSNGIEHITVGVPIPTRKGEETNKCQLVIQDTRTLELTFVPIQAEKYFTYETLKYPDQALYNNSLLTITDIPVSDKHLWRNSYGNIGHRIIGHKFEQTDIEVVSNMSDIIHNDLKTSSSFSEYAKTQNAKQKVIDNCLSKIALCQNIE